MIRRVLARLRHRRRPERTELCPCGAEQPVSRMHLVTDAVPDPETQGGTAMVAAFCPAHCPGGCNHQEDHP